MLEGSNEARPFLSRWRLVELCVCVLILVRVWLWDELGLTMPLSDQDA